MQHHHPPVILVADDSSFWREAVVYALRSDEITVIQGDDLLKSITTAGCNHIDLALIDVKWKHGATGYRLADYLKKIHVPFVFVSGYPPNGYPDKTAEYWEKSEMDSPVAIRDKVVEHLRTTCSENVMLPA